MSFVPAPASAPGAGEGGESARVYVAGKPVAARHVVFADCCRAPSSAAAVLPGILTSANLEL